MTSTIRKLNASTAPDLRIADDVLPLPYVARQAEADALPAERLAPHNADMEEATLGAVMISNGEVMQDIGFLKPEHFFLLKNGLIFEAMQRLWARGDAIDSLTVAIELERFGKLEDVGGDAFLTKLMISTPTYANAKTYAHIVERGYARRGLIAAASEMVRLAQDETLDIDQVMARAIEVVGNATFRPSKRRTTKYDVLHGEIYRKAEAIYLGGEFKADMPTNLHPLDEMLSGGGIERGRLYTFAGRPGMGKTIVMTYLARALAKQRTDRKTNKKVPGKSVLVFSFEMQSEETARRMAASASHVPADKIKRGTLEEAEWRDFTASLSDSANYNLWISQSGGMDLGEVEAEIRQHKMQFGLDVVFIDYVQLVKVISKRGGNREQEISSITSTLKQLAQALDIAVIMAAQVNRQVEARADKRPAISDLRESGAIENDSDVVVLLYRDIVYNENTEFYNVIEFIFGKNRDGKTGTANQYIDLATHTLGNLQREAFAAPSVHFGVHDPHDDVHDGDR